MCSPAMEHRLHSSPSHASAPHTLHHPGGISPCTSTDPSGRTRRTGRRWWDLRYTVLFIVLKFSYNFSNLPKNSLTSTLLCTKIELFPLFCTCLCTPRLYNSTCSSTSQEKILPFKGFCVLAQVRKDNYGQFVRNYPKIMQ